MTYTPEEIKTIMHHDKDRHFKAYIECQGKSNLEMVRKILLTILVSVTVVSYLIIKYGYVD